MRAENKTWTLTGVYGPQSDVEKMLFLEEITDLRTHCLPAWLILGDFNLILNAQEKNNARLNLPMINRFRSTIDNLELARIELRGRKYTWCNDQQTPTMTRIDHFFASTEWLDSFPRTDLCALASLGSDHSALFLQGDVSLDFYKGFRFEAHWTQRPGFLETVKEVWVKPVNTQDAILRLHVKMLRAAKALKNWRRKSLGGWKISWAILTLTLQNLEKAQEERTLTQEEWEFKKYLKTKSMGIAAIQKSRARQHSRLTWIRKGDTNTRFFQLHANMRKKKSFIAILNGDSGPVISQENKSALAFNHFTNLLGSPSVRTRAINWEELGYEEHDLEDLDAPFTMQEIEAVIKDIPSEKAPGPDGFMGCFYKKCWSIIKEDVRQAIMCFFNNQTSKLHLINTANIVLLPKTQDAAMLSDYRPISLINSFVKIITKILANRLAPHMNDLVSHAQNAFIKKRCIHDNFIYAQRVIQLLHKRRKSALFIKLDISKAFDSIGWSFLLEVLENLGFSTKWRDWIAALLGSASSRILINGQPTKDIRHERGLRQGDPLSPLLFILAIDPLQRIIEVAAQRGILSPVLPRAANLRCSLYADDAAIFASPNNMEIEHLHRILIFFGECSGLKINISKTEIYPIRLDTNTVVQLL
jgi:hypothetical protein